MAREPAALVFFLYELEVERQRIQELRWRVRLFDAASVAAAPGWKDGPSFVQRERLAIEQELYPPPSRADTVAQVRAAGLLPP